MSEAKVLHEWEVRGATLSARFSVVESEGVAVLQINGFGVNAGEFAYRLLSELARLDARVRELEAELDRERLRLAACGVVASSNTKESAEKYRQMVPEYHSGSLDAVIAAVDREMKHRERIEQLEAAVRELADAVKTERNGLTRLYHIEIVHPIVRSVIEKGGE